MTNINYKFYKNFFFSRYRMYVNIDYILVSFSVLFSSFYRFLPWRDNRRGAAMQYGTFDSFVSWLGKKFRSRFVGEFPRKQRISGTNTVSRSNAGSSSRREKFAGFSIYDLRISSRVRYVDR